MLATSCFGARLARFDAGWTRLESILCAWVLTLEVFAFTCWIFLKGLSATSTSANRAGIVFRSVGAAVVLGTIAYRVVRKRPPKVRALLVLGASALGIVIGRASGNVGSGYFSNVLNWLQDSSWLTLLGGLRGIGTELTWWLAMLGASLATGGGKHINIDALLRFLKPKFRVPAILVGWVMAALVCFTAVWGFFDHIAIGSFGAAADASPSEKVSMAMREGGRHLFLLRKQLSLDTSTAIHVLGGERYDGWLHGAEWNAWIAEGGWDTYFSESSLQGVLLPESAATDLHPPLVVVPSGHSNPRGLLTKDFHLIFPFGLLMIGLRFVVRLLLVVLGRVSAEGDPHSIANVSSESDGHTPAVETGS